MQGLDSIWLVFGGRRLETRCYILVLIYDIYMVEDIALIRDEIIG